MKLALHQEYLARHNSQASLVLYNKKNVVFLKNDTLWRTLLITWRDQELHPGFYEVRHSQVIHNGYEERMSFESLESTSWYWDQYEPNIHVIAKQLKHEGFKAVPSKEQVLAAWNIFLIITDSWIAKNMDSHFFEKVEGSIRDDYSPEIRAKFLHEAQLMLASTGDTDLIDIWLHQLWPLTKVQNSEWLIRLINE